MDKITKRCAKCKGNKPKDVLPWCLTCLDTMTAEEIVRHDLASERAYDYEADRSNRKSWYAS